METEQNEYYRILKETCNFHKGCKPYRLLSKHEQTQLLSALLEYELIGVGFLEPLIYSNLLQQMILKVITPEEYGYRHLKYVKEGEHIIRISREVRETNLKIRKRIEREIELANQIHIANDPYCDPRCDPDTPEFDDELERSSSARMGA